jgi:hypothetical protein
MRQDYKDVIKYGLSPFDAEALMRIIETPNDLILMNGNVWVPGFINEEFELKGHG